MLTRLTVLLPSLLVVILAIALAVGGTLSLSVTTCADYWKAICPSASGQGVDEFCVLCVSLVSGVIDLEPSQPGPSYPYSSLPLEFEANLGRSKSSASYLARGEGFTALLFSNNVELSLGGRDSAASVRMLLDGASTDAAVEPVEMSQGRVHYLLGSEPAKWITHVPVSRRVRFQSIYPGVDVEYYGAGRNLEHDFIVHPGADPARIRMSFSGAAEASLDSDGALHIKAAGHELVWKKPVVYQTLRGRRFPVEAAYRMSGKSQVRFELGPYNPGANLTIDPVLTYQSYIGRTGNDAAARIAVDGQGNLYFTGATLDSTYPVTPGAFTNTSANGQGDVIVTKVNAAGNGLAYTTHLGGTSVDAGLALAVDPQGNVYVAGTTWSNNFPTTPGALQTQFGRGLNNNEDPTGCFVAKLSSDGSRLTYSTLLGGTRHEICTSIAIDGTGNAYVGGVTSSIDFPVSATAARGRSGGGADGFLAKLNPTGSALVYSTYLGGNNWDGVGGVAVDAQGVLHATGCTSSAVGFPVTSNAAQVRFGGTSGGSAIQCGDAFLSRLSADGSTILYSTYLGGSKDELGIGIALDPQGNAYIAGTTGSPDFPTVAGAFQLSYRGGDSEEIWNSGDAFVAKFAANGTLAYSTYLGGTGDDRAFSIAVDSKGQAWVAGSTLSSNFPTTTNGTQRIFGGRENTNARIPTGDGFVTQLTFNGSAPLFSTFIGGSNNDAAVGIAIDSKDDAYAAGFTSSLNLPTTAAAYQKVAGAGSVTFYPFADAFVSKFGETAVSPGGQPTITSVESAASAIGNGVAAGEIIAIKGTRVGPSTGIVAGVGNNQFPKALAETRVLIDGIEAPLLYVSAVQTNAIVPYGIAGKQTVSVVVEYQTARSATLTVPVLASKPALFTASGTGSGQGAILNENNTYNSAALPATAGTVVQIFGTGDGEVSNTPGDGFLTTPPYPAPKLPVNVTIGGQSAQVVYAAAAPGAVAGLFQVNAVVPTGLAAGNVPVFVKVGDAFSQQGVTLAVR